jgi:hypothetical protein
LPLKWFLPYLKLKNKLLPNLKEFSGDQFQLFLPLQLGFLAGYGPVEGEDHGHAGEGIHQGEFEEKSQTPG